MIHEANVILQTATATLLAFICLALLRNLKQGMHLWAGIGFTLSVFCYLVIETPFVRHSFLWFIALTGSISIPVFLWLLSKSIFYDHFRFTPALVLWFLVQTVPHAHHYFKDILEFPNELVTVLNIVTEI